MFSTAELRWAQLKNAWNQNQSPSCAFLDSTKSTDEAKTDETDSGAAARPGAQNRIVLEQLNQLVPSSAQPHKQEYTGKVRGIYSPPLMLQSDLWVPLI